MKAKIRRRRAEILGPSLLPPLRKKMPSKVKVLHFGTTKTFMR